MASSHRSPRRPARRFGLSAVLLPTVGIGALAVSIVAVVAEDSAPASADAPMLLATSVSSGEPSVSRGGDRPILEPAAAAADAIQGSLFVTADAAIRADAAPDSAVLASAARGQTVAVTGIVEGEWTQVLHNGLPRWVATSQLSAAEPLGSAPCPGGSAVERGLKPDTIKVHRAVCAKFPQVTNYGGLRSDGEHGQGRALDIMVRGARGDEIAAWVRANAAALGVSEVIWEQRIWTVQLAGAGWRPMEDRGGDTANHFDHVHVTTYGNRAQ